MSEAVRANEAVGIDALQETFRGEIDLPGSD